MKRSTCYFCHGAWGACRCPFPTSDPELSFGFECGDLWICEPNVSECGRFYVHPVEAYGEPYIAWAKAHPDLTRACENCGRTDEGNTCCPPSRCSWCGCDNDPVGGDCSVCPKCFAPECRHFMPDGSGPINACETAKRPRCEECNEFTDDEGDCGECVNCRMRLCDHDANPDSCTHWTFPSDKSGKV